MDQSTWNLLFGWMQGEQCFLPEGCPPPVEGILFYLAVVIIIVAAYLHYSDSEVLDGWRRS